MAELIKLTSEDNIEKNCDAINIMSRCEVKTMLNVSIG